MSYLASVILVTCLLDLTIGNPVVRLIRYSNDRDLNKYSYDFETDNGISRSESGEIKTENNKEVLSVRGNYTYSESGKLYVVTYTADENGYHPKFRIDKETTLLLAVPKSRSYNRGASSALLASLAGGGLG